jgi:uncharacterized damage-inducible protein DinB
MDRLLADSFSRNCTIMDALALLVTPANQDQKPSEDGMPLWMQLAHVHKVRLYWLSQFSPAHMAGLGEVHWDEAGCAAYSADLDFARAQLKLSGEAVLKAFTEKTESWDTNLGPYENTVLFLQHMLWHDGYHFALIHLGLRMAGVEISEEWEESHVWSKWRGFEEGF